MMDASDARRRLVEARIYGIVDLGYVGGTALERMTERLCEGGVDLLQLRAKGFSAAEVEAFGRRIHPLTLEHGVPLIINDHPAVAAMLGVEGVHIGQDDADVTSTRQTVGRDCLIGKSSHSIAQAAAAGAEDVDYIGFGPLFATDTKPDYQAVGLADIAEVHRRVAVPVFCIGGVQRDRMGAILKAGAGRVVAVSALLTAPDPAAAVRELKDCLAGLG